MGFVEEADSCLPDSREEERRHAWRLRRAATLRSAIP